MTVRATARLQGGECVVTIQHGPPFATPLHRDDTAAGHAIRPRKGLDAVESAPAERGGTRGRLPSPDVPRALVLLHRAVTHIEADWGRDALLDVRNAIRVLKGDEEAAS